MYQHAAGQFLGLAWKTNKRDCKIEIKEVHVEVAIRFFDKATEQFPKDYDATPLSVTTVRRSDR